MEKISSGSNQIHSFKVWYILYNLGKTHFFNIYKYVINSSGSTVNNIKTYLKNINTQSFCFKTWYLLIKTEAPRSILSLSLDRTPQRIETFSWRSQNNQNRRYGEEYRLSTKLSDFYRLLNGQFEWYFEILNMKLSLNE